MRNLLLLLDAISRIGIVLWFIWTVADIRDKLDSIESTQIECNAQKGE
jgi:hypothetical protein